MQTLISVEGIKIWAYHGVYAEEQLTGRYFLVDVFASAEIDQSGILSDDLSATCNYETFYEQVVKAMSERKLLLEKVALEIGQNILNQDVRIKNVRVKVSKLNPPLGKEIAATAVEIIVQA